MTGTGLAVITSSDLAERYPAFSEDNAMEAFEANLGGDESELSVFELDRVKVPAGGALAWEVPALEGEEYLKELTGVVVATISRRSFWETDLDDSDGNNGPPDCASDDAKFGKGMYGVGSDLHPEGDCGTCEQNQWHTTDSGRQRKPCQEQRLVLFLREGDILPVVIQLAPTSIKNMRGFMIKLASRKVPYYRAIIKLKLEKREKPVAHSVISPELVEVVDAEAGVVFKKLGDQVEAGYRRQTGTAVTVS